MKLIPEPINYFLAFHIQNVVVWTVILLTRLRISNSPPDFWVLVYNSKRLTYIWHSSTDHEDDVVVGREGVGHAA